MAQERRAGPDALADRAQRSTSCSPSSCLGCGNARQAWLVAISAVGALLLYRYHEPGELGPLPDMYEPLWFRERVVTGATEALAVVTSTVGLIHRGRISRLRAERSVCPIVALYAYFD